MPTPPSQQDNPKRKVSDPEGQTPNRSDVAQQVSNPNRLKPNLRLGLALGLIGVVVFGTTLPVTRIAVLELDPLYVTTVRALIACVLAAAFLLVAGVAPPPRDTLPTLFVFGLCVVVGYPLLMGTAMRYAPASHGGVVLAVQPLLTATASLWVAGERPSPAFWACSLAGSTAAVAYAVISSAMTSGATSGSWAMELHWADLLLAGAAIAGSYGYTLGGHLTQRMPGWLVISWALIVMLPIMLVVYALVPKPAVAPSGTAWACLVFLGMFPMYLGFFAWNRGLSIGGIAKVGQVQLIQPFITLAAAALLLGERIGWLEITFSTLVVGLVALGSRLRVSR